MHPTYPDPDKPELERERLPAPEEVVMRRHAISGLKAATIQARIAEHGEFEESTVQEQVASITDLDAYRANNQSVADIAQEPTPIQSSQPAESNSDEIAHLRRIRELEDEAKRFATVSSDQVIARANEQGQSHDS